MRINLLLLLVLLGFYSFTNAQTVEFSDDFESGTGNWDLTGDWDVSDEYANSGSFGLTESPGGNYPDNITSSATMSSGVNLSTALDANLSFYAIYDIEMGFDYMYVEVTNNFGTDWINLATFDGENDLASTPFEEYTYSLGGFVGSTDVRIRFRFVSDAGVNENGMVIDDFEITSSMIDNAAPLLLHDAPVHYEGSAGVMNLNATLIDVSGISATELTYSVDGGTAEVIPGINIGGDNWLYSIPSQSAGSNVRYTIYAEDASSNSVTSESYSYIAGNHLIYDNGVVDFVNSFGPDAMSLSNQCAVRISLGGEVDLTSVLIRNYTDATRPNDSMQVHIWADAAGVPGADLIPPITMFPEANLTVTSPMTRVDLRGYPELEGISGDIFVGYSVDEGQTWLVQSTPGISNRTLIYDGLDWIAITDDYHFRAVTTVPAGSPIANFSYDNSADPEILFTDLSTNDPDDWDWDFGDGFSSDIQDPSHTYSANGTYNVCLTASNASGSNTTCQAVVVSGIAVTPIAGFSFDDSMSPEVSFMDLSLNGPEEWLWDFDDASATSIEQNPTHTFTGPGTYNVCLTASNGSGSSAPFCQDVTLIETGIGVKLETDISIYPNPAADFIQVSWPAAQFEKSLKLMVFDMKGSLLITEKVPAGSLETNLNVSTLESGLYTLQLTDGIKTGNSIFIVE